MIRKANKQDIPQLIDLLEREQKKHGYNMPFDEGSCELQLRNLMIMQNGFLSVWDDGSIKGVCGGPLVNWPYDLNCFVIQEYIAAGVHLGALREAFFGWGKDMNAKAYIKLCIDPSSGFRVRRLGDN